VPGWDGEVPFNTGGQLHVHVKRRGGDIGHGSGDILHRSSDDPNLDTVLLIGGNGGGGHLLVTRLGHLQV
jgi:hypothetical protein